MKNQRKTSPGVSNMDAIDQILSTDEQLVPSSGFLAAVMERVHEEAAAPPPFPFPWKRALPGVLLAVAVFGWGTFELVRYAPLAMRQSSFTAPHLSALAFRDLTQAGWIVVACVAPLLSWWLSSRLTRRSGIF